MGGDWPLVGRTEELGLLRRLRSARPARGAVITGPAGVGKSRLVASAAAEAAAEGWTTLAVRATAGFSGLPLGPLRTVLRVEGSGDLNQMTAAVEAELTRLLSGRGLLVLADDCHELDDASAGLLHQMSAAGLITVLITARSGLRLPVAVTDLWKDGLAERIELENLSRREAVALLSGGLGGSVEDNSADRIWHVTAGNPLYLREVVLSSLETGALREVDGDWSWRGQWARGSRVQEIVAARLGRLGPEESTAIEMIALAGSLPLALVSGLTTTRAVEELEARALVTLESSGRRLEVRIAHPLHAEVLRESMPTLRRRAIWRNLVDALTATGTRRISDRVRLACWSLEAGVPVDPITLTLGSDASLFGIGYTLANRLQEILPGFGAGSGEGSPAVREDFDLAVRLARAAYETTESLGDGLALAAALAWTGNTDEAELLLAQLVERQPAGDDRLRLVRELAWVQFWGHYDVEAAKQTLDEAIGAAPGGDRILLAELLQERAGIELNTANPSAALAFADRAVAAEAVELHESVAAPVAAAALSYLGRCGDALGLIDRAIPVASESGHPLQLAILLFTRGATLARTGQLEEARAQLAWLRDVAVTEGLLDAAGAFGVLLGEILLRQGRPATAGRILRDSCGLLSERDVLGYRPWALYGLARARAHTGELEAGTAALEEARRIQVIGRHYDMASHLATVDLYRLQGRSDSALEAAVAGARWARSRGMLVDEAYALHACIRIAPSEEAVWRLAELATLADTALVGALADHAAAALARDPELLLDVSRRLGEMSANGMAAEAAALAASIYDRQGKARPSKAALRLAAELSGQCEGLVAEAAADPANPARLTKREREIATLAAAGRSSREIAEQMYLSARTVENHLHHVYVKLGVTDRAQLAEALTSSV